MKPVAKRRTLDETRDLILAAAVEIIMEDGFVVAPQELTLIDACRRAGLSTTGSGYKIWPDQRTFQADALRSLLRFGTESMIDFSSELANVELTNPTLPEVIRVMGKASVQQVVGQDAFVLFVTMWCAAQHETELLELLRADDQIVIEKMDGIYELLLEVFDLEMVPPYTVRALTVAFASLIVGLGLHSEWITDAGLDKIERPTGPEGAMQQWHIMSCACEAMVNAFTRPSTESSHRSSQRETEAGDPS